jgi:hypothetical protein
MIFVFPLLLKYVEIKIYKTIIFPYFVCAWNLICLVKEEHRLRVFESPCGVVLSVLVTGPRVADSNPAKDRF